MKCTATSNLNYIWLTSMTLLQTVSIVYRQITNRHFEYSSRWSQGKVCSSTDWHPQDPINFSSDPIKHSIDYDTVKLHKTPPRSPSRWRRMNVTLHGDGRAIKTESSAVAESPTASWINWDFFAQWSWFWSVGRGMKSLSDERTYEQMVIPTSKAPWKNESLKYTRKR